MLKAATAVAVKARSKKQAQLEHSRQRRGQGATWVEIASEFREAYGVNARVATRLAHGWSQADAANAWNSRWPDDLRTYKNFSYWEQWPARTGYTPSLDVLIRLAELYQCRVSDLLADGPDFTEADEMRQAQSDLEILADAVPSGGDVGTFKLAELASRIDQADVEALGRAAATWGQHLDVSIDRRALLMKMSYALTIAAAAPDSVSGHLAPGRPQDTGDLSGIWRSRYVYRSSGRQEEFEDIHYVVLEHAGRQASVSSLAHTTGSEIGMELAVDAYTATGTWEERTSPTGYYKGAVYRGAIQLLVAPSGGQMTGKWLGFGRNFAVNSGDWDLTLESRNTSEKARRRFALKA